MMKQANIQPLLDKVDAWFSKAQSSFSPSMQETRKDALEQLI